MYAFVISPPRSRCTNRRNGDQDIPVIARRVRDAGARRRPRWAQRAAGNGRAARGSRLAGRFRVYDGPRVSHVRPGDIGDLNAVFERERPCSILGSTGLAHAMDGDAVTVNFERPPARQRR